MYLNYLHCHRYYHSSLIFSFLSFCDLFVWKYISLRSLFYSRSIYHPRWFFKVTSIVIFFFKVFLLFLLHACVCWCVCTHVQMWVEVIGQSWVLVFMRHPFTLFFIGTCGSPVRLGCLSPTKPRGSTCLCLLSSGISNVSMVPGWWGSSSGPYAYKISNFTNSWVHIFPGILNFYVIIFLKNV